MKNMIFQAITGMRNGFVVHVDYNQYVHWTDNDSAFIVFSKGNLDINVDDNDDLTISGEKSEDEKAMFVAETEVINLKELAKTMQMYKYEYRGWLYGQCIIIKIPPFVKNIDFASGIYVNDVFTAEKLLTNFCDDHEMNIKIYTPTRELSILNKFIQTYPSMLSHVEYMSEYELAIVTNYNPEVVVGEALNRYYKKYEKKERKAQKQINMLMGNRLEECASNEDLEDLMNLYAETSKNPYDSISKQDMESDDAYYALLKDMKNRL